MYEITLCKAITKEEEGRYLEVPFPMPEKTERIDVAYEIIDKGAVTSVVDLGIRDDSRVRGWSGGARKSFYLTVEKATPGYLPGSLKPGEWAVLLGGYKIAKTGCEVKITIQFTMREPRWYKGDLHTHSNHSDGMYSLEEVVSIAEKHQLDFIALTDHNTVSQNFCFPKENNIVFIAGMEFTTHHGHCNFLGVADPVRDFRVSSSEEALAKVAEARQSGALIVLNHPHCSFCPWEWSMDVAYDCVEIWNGPWREDNQRTLDWWQQQLSLGRKIVAVGGSDVHRPHPFIRHGFPTTWIYSEGRDTSSLLQALRQGHTFITYAPEAPTVHLRYRDKMMGDQACVKEGNINTAFTGLAEGDHIRFYTNRGLAAEHIATENIQRYQVEVKNEKFLRAEVWRKFNIPDVIDAYLPVTISNPIYFNTKE